MAKNKITDIVAKIVDILTPLSKEERARIIGASLTLLGDEPSDLKKHGGKGDDIGDANGSDAFLPKVKAWMKQNTISMDQLEEVFHIADSSAEVIASEIPGNNDKEKTYNVYVLTGIAGFLATGNANFDDKSARALCKSSGCFNTANHAAYLGSRGNEFTGSKEKGWILTAPGLKRGANLIKEISKEEK
jgi:hypothetical protein